MRLYTALSLVALPVASLAAQQPPQAQCDSAQAAVSGQPLPASGSTGWSWWITLRACGNEGAVTMAQVVQSPAVMTETDSVRLGHLFYFFYGVRSPDLYTAYTAVAQNAGATVPVRLYSLTALGKLSVPELNFAGRDFVNPSITVCPSMFDMTDSSSTGAPLAAGYTASIYATMKALEAAGGGPAAVRGAAHCWRVRLARGQPLDPATVTLKYVCGNNFLISNQTIGTYSFTFQSVGANVKTSEQGAITASGPGDTPISMLYPSTLRLFYNGVQIQSTPNGHTACP